jgi:hypothetical protein
MKNLTINLNAQRFVLVFLFSILFSLPVFAQTYTRTITTPLVTSQRVTNYQNVTSHQTSVTETRIEVTITQEPQRVTRTVTVPPTVVPRTMLRTVAPTMPRVVTRPVPVGPERSPRGNLYGPFWLQRVLDGDSFIADLADGSDIVNLIGVESSQDIDYSILLGRLIGGKPFWLELDEFERGLDGNILAYLYVEDLQGDWHWNGLRLTQINLHMLTTGIATYNPGINARYRDIYQQLPEDIVYVETVPLVYRYQPDRLVDIDLSYLDPNYFERPTPLTPRYRSTW